jgi:hypothetical protein
VQGRAVFIERRAPASGVPVANGQETNAIPLRDGSAERTTEVFAALFLTVIGLSHVAQPRAWVEFFSWLRGKGHPGMFVNGFMSLGFGSFIVASHNVWSGLPAILTVIGWGQVLKGLLSFVAPRLSMWGLERVSPERAWVFVAGGVVSLVLAALIWYVVFTH